MRTIIAGSRGIHAYVKEAVEASGFEITRVISGGARGVDRSGEDWAAQNNIPVTQYIPDWDNIGKSAGYRRNSVMARNADALIAIWDGKSKGTAHMIEEAKKRHLKVYVHIKEEKR